MLRPFEWQEEIAAQIRREHSVGNKVYYEDTDFPANDKSLFTVCICYICVATVALCRGFGRALVLLTGPFDTAIVNWNGGAGCDGAARLRQGRAAEVPGNAAMVRHDNDDVQFDQRPRQQSVA